MLELWLADTCRLALNVSDGYHIINGALCEAPLKQEANVNLSAAVKQTAGVPGIFHGMGFQIGFHNSFSAALV